MISDRKRWDSRYLSEGDNFPEPDAFLVEHSHLLEGGRAFYPACGLGGNALFLAERGYRVDATDISVVALRRLLCEASARNLPVRVFVADLDYFPLPRDLYDLVLVFNFFAPTLIAAIKASVRSGGLIFYSTYNFRHTSLKPGFNPEYLVPRGGLFPYFQDLDILVDEPEAGEAMNVSRLIARKSA